MSLRLLLAILVTNLASGVAFATSKEFDTDHLLRKAESLDLGQHKDWLSLLHYNRGGTLHARQQSYVSSQSFFLSNKGHKDPRSELRENIKAFFGGNMDSRCQFPARFQWLSRQLDLPVEPSALAHCQKLQSVKARIQARQLVLVFPSAYMGSASSIFGHTLFRIDNTTNRDAVVLNWAINFGAQLNNEDNAFEYGFKGVFGLYKGRYFMVPYSQKIKEYGQMENRDIWEYPLTLTQKEVNFMIDHLWELQGVDFNYYFFDENCSYRLLELLEVARPSLNMTESFRFTEIPIDTVKTLNDAGLIESSVFRASKERLLRARLAGLNTAEIKLVEQLANPGKASAKTIQNRTFQAANAQQQLLILQTAYEYLRFRQSEKERDEGMARRSLDLLGLINQHTQDYQHEISIEEPDYQVPENILNSHDSQRLTFGGGRILKEHNYLRAQYRMAYHDLLDNSAAYLNGAHIEGPAITALKNPEDTHIDAWQLLDIQSLNPVDKLHQKISWKLSLQGTRSQEGNTHMSTVLQGGAGFAWEKAGFMHYQMLVPRIETNPAFQENTKVGMAWQGGLLRNTGRNATQLQFAIIKLDAVETKLVSELSQQFELSRNQALRLKAGHFRQKANPRFNKNNLLEISYLYYF